MPSRSIETLRFGLLLALLVSAGLFINIWERASEAHVERQALANFPAQMGNWRQQGSDQRFDKESEKVLRADDYLSRNFALPDGHTGSFYVGYYATQRNGATYHSPLNCLPGSGWVLNSPATIQITPADGGSAFQANRYIIQNGDTRQVLIYWYQGRGRVVASEYWGKIYTVIDSVRERRSDGAMVRVLVPIGKSEPEAIRVATDMASQAAPLLPAYVPN